jgi:TPR repeat protein
VTGVQTCALPISKLTELYAELERNAEAGDITAWADMGDALLYGMGCEQDVEKALEYFRKGAELGDKQACFAIYDMSSNGVSLVGDDEADAMLQKAAELGHGKAEFLRKGGD